MIHETLQATTGMETFLLVGLLIAAFVIAFKIMKMVFETILASILSAAFYISLGVLFNFPLNFERVLLFAFLGASLYMGYAFLISAYTVASYVLEIPYRILKSLATALIRTGSKAHHRLEEGKKKIKQKKREKRKNKINSQKEKKDSEENERDVKEVVLDKVKNEEED